MQFLHLENSWGQITNDSISISIDEVKELTKRMIERNYYIKISKTQEEIIDEQNKVINILTDKNKQYKEELNRIIKDRDLIIKQSKVKNGIIIGLGSTTLLLTILIILL